jgi:hypothetical protein
LNRTWTTFWSRGRLIALAVAFAFLVSVAAPVGVLALGPTSSAASHAQHTPAAQSVRAANQPPDQRAGVIVQKADSSTAADDLVASVCWN